MTPTPRYYRKNQPSLGKFQDEWSSPESARSKTAEVKRDSIASGRRKPQSAVKVPRSNKKQRPQSGRKSPATNVFQQNMSILKRYVKANGSWVPRESVDKETGFRVGDFVANVKKFQACLSEKERGEFVEMGIDLGYHVVEGVMNWDEGMAALETFVETTGKSPNNVPDQYRDKNGFELGKWLCCAKKSNALSDSMKERLVELGVTLETNQKAAHNADNAAPKDQSGTCKSQRPRPLQNFQALTVTVNGTTSGKLDLTPTSAKPKSLAPRTIAKKEAAAKESSSSARKSSEPAGKTNLAITSQKGSYGRVAKNQAGLRRRILSCEPVDSLATISSRKPIKKRAPTESILVEPAKEAPNRSAEPIEKPPVETIVVQAMMLPKKKRTVPRVLPPKKRARDNDSSTSDFSDDSSDEEFYRGHGERHHYNGVFAGKRRPLVVRSFC